MPVWNKPNKSHPNGNGNGNRFHSSGASGGNSNASSTNTNSMNSSNHSGGGGNGGNNNNNNNNNGPPSKPPHHIKLNNNSNNNKVPYYNNNHHHHNRRNSNPFHNNNNSNTNNSNYNNNNSNNNNNYGNNNNNHFNNNNNHRGRPYVKKPHSKLHYNKGGGGGPRQNQNSYHSSSWKIEKGGCISHSLMNNNSKMNNSGSMNNNSMNSNNANTNSSNNSHGSNSSSTGLKHNLNTDSNSNTNMNMNTYNSNTNNSGGGGGGSSSNNGNGGNNNSGSTTTGTTSTTVMNNSNNLKTNTFLKLNNNTTTSTSTTNASNTSSNTNSSSSSSSSSRPMPLSATKSATTELSAVITTKLPPSSSLLLSQQQQQQLHNSSDEEGEIAPTSTKPTMNTNTNTNTNINTSSINANKKSLLKVKRPSLTSVSNTFDKSIGSGNVTDVTGVSSSSSSLTSGGISKKFTPPPSQPQLQPLVTPSSSSLSSSQQQPKQQLQPQQHIREEGEIQPTVQNKTLSSSNNNHMNKNSNTTTTTTTNMNKNSNNAHSNVTTNSSKPLWTPPPGASSSASNKNKGPLVSSTSNNNNNNNSSTLNTSTINNNNHHMTNNSTTTGGGGNGIGSGGINTNNSSNGNGNNSASVSSSGMNNTSSNHHQPYYYNNNRNNNNNHHHGHGALHNNTHGGGGGSNSIDNGNGNSGINTNKINNNNEAYRKHSWMGGGGGGTHHNSWNTNRDNNDGNNINHSQHGHGHKHGQHSHGHNKNGQHGNIPAGTNKWDKPNNMKKRFLSLDNYSNNNNINAIGGIGSSKINTNNSGSWNHSKSGGGGGGNTSGNIGNSSTMKSNSIGSGGSGGGSGYNRPSNLLSNSWKRNSSTNQPTAGSNSSTMDSSGSGPGGGDYYGPSSSSGMDKDKMTRTSNPNFGEPKSTSSNIAPRGGTGNSGSARNIYSTNNDGFSPSSTIRKKFQPPPKKGFSLHSNTLSSSSSLSTAPRSMSANSTSFMRDDKHGMKRQVSLENTRSTSLNLSSSYSAPNSPGKSIKRITSMDSGGRKHTYDPRWKPASSNSECNPGNSSTSTNRASSLSSPPFKSDIKKSKIPAKMTESPIPLLSKSSSFVSAKDRAFKNEPRVVSDYSLLSSSAPLLNKREAMSSKNTSSSTTEGTQTKTNSSTPSTPSIQPRLTCAALGDSGNVTRARYIIRKLSKLLSDGSLNVINGTVNTMPLPSTDQIHHGIKDIESRIEKRKLECVQIKGEHENEMKKRRKELEERVKAMAALAAARKKKEEEQKKAVQEQLLKEQEAKRDCELQMNNQVKEITKKVEEEEKAEECRLKEEMEKMKETLMSFEKEIFSQRFKQEEARLERERIKMKEEAVEKIAENEILIAKIETEGRKVKMSYERSKALSEQSDKAIKNAMLPKVTFRKKFKAEDAILDSTPDIVESKNMGNKVSPRLKSILSLTKDKPEDMTNLISSIYRQNREAANIAHQKALSLIPCTSSKDLVSPPGLVQEKPIDVNDNGAVSQYINHWSNLTRQVTGPGDALYTKPSESPLYKSNEKNHENMKLLVKEHVRSKKRKLHSRWIELAQEYTVRQEKYSKETNLHASSYTSADVGDLPILAGGIDYSPDASSGRSSGNPYRRARRSVMSGVGGSDVVRSEYEQEQIIAQLAAKENMEKRIKQGGSKLPRQRCQLEKELHVSYRDTLSSRRVLNPLEEAKEQRHTNPWSDIEKCIFLDRFLQHPKDFRKIASFLKNKSVHDCISFYYDSKQSVPYKRALREHSKRKKRRGDSVKWEATIQAAISVGAKVNVGISSEKPLIFDLPRNDLTFHTRYFHPMKREIFDVISGDASPFIEIATRQEVKKNSHKKKSSLANNLFTLDLSKRKYLRSFPDYSIKNAGSGSSDMDSEKQKVRQRSDSPPVRPVVKPEKTKIIKMQKWSTGEKTLFHENFEKVGKEWDVLSEAIGTKTSKQVKQFYVDNKKYVNKNRITPTTEVVANNNVETQQVPTSDPIVEPKQDQVIKPIPTSETTETRTVAHGFSRANVIAMQEQQRESVDQGLQSQPTQGPPEHWMHENNQNSHLALAIEHHRQQQLAQQLSQSQQQQFLELQRQEQQRRQMHRLQQQHQIQNLLGPHQNDFTAHQHQQQMMFAAQLVQARQQQQQQQSLQDYLEGGGNLQDVALALATQHQQNNYQLGLNPSNNLENDAATRQQANDLSLLAQMAADVNRKHQDSRNH